MSLACTACGSGGSAGSTAAPLNHNTKATLTVWTYLDTTGAGAQEFAAENALFHQQFPKVNVDVVQIPSASEDSKLLAAAASRTGPDVVQDNPDVDMYELAASGAITDMSSYWNSYSQKSEFPSSSLWRYKGEIVTAQSYVNVLGIWYNRTLLSSIGLKPAATITQLKAQLPKIKAHGDTALMADAAPGVANATWQIYPWIAAQSGSFCSFSNNGTVSALTDLADWYKNGYLSAAATTWDNQDITTSGFFNGKVAYVEDGNWAASALATAHLGFKYGAEQMFTGPAGSRVLPGGEGWAIGGFSSQKQLAFDYLKDSWLSAKGGQTSYQQAGVIATRQDVAPLLAKDTLVQPFLRAVKTEVPWPSNSQANKAETDLGTVLSGVVAGSTSPSTGASQAAQEVKSDLATGTGSCGA